MGIFITIDGKQYNSIILDRAKKLAAAKVDADLSVDDVGQLLEVITENSEANAFKRETMIYVKDRYSWTNAAAEWLQIEINKRQINK